MRKPRAIWARPPWQTIRHVVLPIIAPSLIGVALFGFTLSYDEFARTLLTSGSYNTLPLEIYGMTTNVTSPVLYALGTLTTVFSLIDHRQCSLGIAVWMQPAQRAKQGIDAGKGYGMIVIINPNSTVSMTEAMVEDCSRRPARRRHSKAGHPRRARPPSKAQRTAKPACRPC